jgi:DNA-binding NarL/FixJ family response regulator
MTPWESALIIKRSKGQSIKSIAKEFRLAESTIKNTLRVAYLKAGAKFFPSDSREYRANKIKEIADSLGTRTEAGDR